MSLISDTFDKLKTTARTAFMPFSVAGFPDSEQSLEVFRTLGRGDIIEFGFPFSDPTADGPVIQEAAAQAIQNGMTMVRAFEMIRTYRKRSNTPVVFFSYFNPIHKYGAERFAEHAKEAGVSGVLVVDLPLEESDRLKLFTDKVGLDWIFLIAPTTPLPRIRRMDELGSGFLYYVSVLGVTGERTALPEDLGATCDMIRRSTHLPLVVGFGISSPEQAGMLKSHVDGVVVGSAIVSQVKSGGPESLDQWITTMKAALA